MKRKWILLLMLASASPIRAAEPAKATAASVATPAVTPSPTPIVDKWNKELVVNLNLSQAAFSDWAAGGSNSLAWQAGLNFKLERDNAAINWLNTVKLNYGLTDTEGQGTRISADLIDLESVFSWKTWPQVSPFVSLAALSQFGAGYDYTPATPVQTSDFLDPGYFTEAAGLKWTASPEFNTRLGVALKETVADKFASIYKAQTQWGANWVSELNHKLDESALLDSKLDIFLPDTGTSYSVIQWNNLLTCKFGKILNVNLEGDLRYDPAVSSKIQILESLGVGFSFTLL